MESKIKSSRLLEKINFDLKNRSLEEIEKKLKTSIESGLSNKEALRRSKGFLNKVISFFYLFYRFIYEHALFAPMYLAILILLVGLFWSKSLFFIPVFIVLYINFAMGMAHLYNLKNVSALFLDIFNSKVWVRRDGQKVWIDKKKLVLGDLIYIYPNKFVSTDIKIVKAENLLVDEFFLKDLLNDSDNKFSSNRQLISEDLLYSGSFIKGGRGYGIVVAIEKNSFLGKISANKFSKIPKENGLHKILDFCRNLSVLFTIFWGTSLPILLINENIEKLQFANLFFSILISLIATIGIKKKYKLAKAALKAAKKNLFLKDLTMIEKLKKIDSICLNKTGILTRNDLSFCDCFFLKQIEEDVNIFNFQENLEYVQTGIPGISSKESKNKNCDITEDKNIFVEEKLNLKLMACASINFEKLDPFEDAIYKNLSERDKGLLENFKIYFEPKFDANMRIKTKLAQVDDKFIMIYKGAAEIIVDYSSNLNSSHIKKLRNLVELYEGKGKRIIAIATKITNKITKNLKPEKRDLNFLGLIVFEDAINHNAKKMIKKAEELKLSIKIFTGDSPILARSIGVDMGLIPPGEGIITGYDIKYMNKEQKLKALENYKIFSRITPEQKSDLTGLLQEKHHVAFLSENLNPKINFSNNFLNLSVYKIHKKPAFQDIFLINKNLLALIDGISLSRKVF